MMKQKRFSSMIPIIMWTLFMAIPSSVVAATTTPNPTPFSTTTPAISEEDVRESLRNRLKRAAEEKVDEARGALASLGRRAIVGTLKDMTSTTLTVTMKSGEVRFAAVSETTVFVRKTKTVLLDDVALGDYLIVMGYPGDNDILDARRVVITDGPTSRDSERVVRGTVSNVNTRLKTFTLTVARPAERGNPEVITVSLPKKTTQDISEIAEEDTVIAVGTQVDKNKPNLTLLKFKIINPSP